tara:strand:+ start:228 stop:410 length:183 start_codon:yes stop_codon:yes gene_type:complete
MSEKTYRIESLQTTGWEIVEPLGKYEKLTREQAKKALDMLIEHEEYNPNSLRAIPDGTTE